MTDTPFSTLSYDTLVLLSRYLPYSDLVNLVRVDKNTHSWLQPHLNKHKSFVKRYRNCKFVWNGDLPDHVPESTRRRENVFHHPIELLGEIIDNPSILAYIRIFTMLPANPEPRVHGNGRFIQQVRRFTIRKAPTITQMEHAVPAIRRLMEKVLQAGALFEEHGIPARMFDISTAEIRDGIRMDRVDYSVYFVLLVLLSPELGPRAFVFHKFPLSSWRRITEEATKRRVGLAP